MGVLAYVGAFLVGTLLAGQAANQRPRHRGFRGRGVDDDDPRTSLENPRDLVDDARDIARRRQRDDHAIGGRTGRGPSLPCFDDCVKATVISLGMKIRSRNSGNTGPSAP
ncbi:hypothetical protein VB636_09830 [Paracoccus sp. APAP_BH8]|uniref:hypothetical protein n=1 Tax=Paracoccus sp. APAP_BH8 TaxID=3110237 RepID=UPI002FD7EAB2